MPASPVSRQAVRSYVRREGRITKAQSRALDELWPSYGIDCSEGILDLRQLYGNDSPTVAEIGFGDGEALAAMASDHPEWNFLGIEVYRPGVGSLLLKLRKLDLTNVRLIQEDAVCVLRDRLGDECLSKLLIFFPDPWPKKRHNKRRLMQQPFLDIALARLQVGGQIHFATDWEDYAAEVLGLLEGESRLRNTAGSGFAPHPGGRPQTKYEDRGRARGHEVWDLVFERVA